MYKKNNYLLNTYAAISTYLAAIYLHLYYLLMDILNNFFDETSEEDDVDEIVPVPKRKCRDFSDPFSNLSEQEIIERYRFSVPVIMKIVDLVSDDLQYESNRNAPLSPLENTCLALRYLASNAFQQVVGDTRRVSKSEQKHFKIGFFYCIRYIFRHCLSKRLENFDVLGKTLIEFCQNARICE